MSNVVEAQKGIFEFTSPQEMSTEEWLNEHLDCDAIIDNLGKTIIVYAFTREPRYNYILESFKKMRRLDRQHILRGISSDGLNSLV